MRKVRNIAYLLGSLVCAAGSLGMTTQPLFAANTAAGQSVAPSAEIVTWRQKMMEPRDRKPGCYMATYPNAVWSVVPCDTPEKDTTTAKTSEKPYLAVPVHPMTTGDDNYADYVAQSQGSITSATGTLMIGHNTSAVGFGTVPNEFSIQLNTKPFVSSNPGCQYNAGCTGWVQFLIDSGGSIQMQSWFLGYLLNAANTSCPAGFNQYAGGASCFANLGYKKLPSILPFAQFSGVQLTGEADSVNNTITMSLPSGLLMQSVTANSVLGLAGKWQFAEFNVFGNSNGDETIFNPGTDVQVQLALTDGTSSAPFCNGYSTYTAETTNMFEGICTEPAGIHGIQFEESVPPNVITISPNVGPTNGGTTVGVYGQGFTSKMQAAFGGTTLLMTGCTPTYCTVVTPKGEGAESFSVANLGITGNATASSDLVTPMQFTYKDALFASMSPTSGTSATTVTISGGTFDTAANKTSVSFSINGVATPAVGLVCSTTVCTLQPPAKPSSDLGYLQAPVTMTVDGQTISLGNFEYPPNTVKKPTPPPCHGTCI
jgi:IPT/TIG domain